MNKLASLVDTIAISNLKTLLNHWSTKHRQIWDTVIFLKYLKTSTTIRYWILVKYIMTSFNISWCSPFFINGRLTMLKKRIKQFQRRNFTISVLKCWTNSNLSSNIEIFRHILVFSHICMATQSHFPQGAKRERVWAA